MSLSLSRYLVAKVGDRADGACELEGLEAHAMNTQDLIALAEQHGAWRAKHFENQSDESICFSFPEDLEAFCAAIAAAQPKAEESEYAKSLIETLGKIADFLSIDLDAAKKAPGKPSDVYIAAINKWADERGSAEPCATCGGRGYITLASSRGEDEQELCPECATAPARDGSEPGLREALTLAREYVEGAAGRMYDGTNGHGIRTEAKRRLAVIDAALAAIEKDRAERSEAVPVALSAEEVSLLRFLRESNILMPQEKAVLSKVIRDAAPPERSNVQPPQRMAS